MLKMRSGTLSHTKKSTNPPYVTATVCNLGVFLGVVNAINVKLQDSSQELLYIMLYIPDPDPIQSYGGMKQLKLRRTFGVSLCTLYLFASQVRVTMDDSSWHVHLTFFFFCVSQLLPFVCWLYFSDSLYHGSFSNTI